MWYELNEGDKLIKKQCDDLLDIYTITEMIGDKEVINIEDMWEMIELLCYRLEKTKEDYKNIKWVLEKLNQDREEQ